MIRLFSILVVLSGCNLAYDFDDLDGMPCNVDPGCQRGYSCLTDDGVSGICVKPTSRAAGETCSRNIQCAQGMICDNAYCYEGQDNCERLCRIGCDPSNMLSCGSPTELCFPAREEGAQGQGFCQRGNCQSAQDCEADEICVRDSGRVKAKGVCTKGCDMLDTVSCGENRGCSFWFGDLNQAACDHAGTLLPGTQCNIGTGTCAPGSACVEQPREGDPTYSSCLQLCDPAGARGAPCASPNPTCVAIPGMNLGICSSLCDPFRPGQCGVDAAGTHHSCQPTDAAVWQCGTDGSGCTCGTSCDPSSAEPGTCALGAPCENNASCPDGMLCSGTAACRPICSLTAENTECEPQPDVAQPTCREYGNNPTFGVCE